MYIDREDIWNHIRKFEILEHSIHSMIMEKVRYLQHSKTMNIKLQEKWDEIGLALSLLLRHFFRQNFSWNFYTNLGHKKSIHTPILQLPNNLVQNNNLDRIMLGFGPQAPPQQHKTYLILSEQ